MTHQSPVNTTSATGIAKYGTVTPPTGVQFAHLAIWIEEALRRMPYFSPIIFNFRAVNAPGLGTFAVDDKMRLYVDFEAVIPRGLDWCAESLCHEAGHVWNDHCERATETGVPIAFAERRLWNYAGDFAINDDLVECGMKTLSDMLSDQHIGEAQHQTAEHYYGVMKDKLDAHRQEHCDECGGRTDENGQSTSPHQPPANSDAYEKGRQQAEKDQQEQAEDPGQEDTPQGPSSDDPGQGNGSESADGKCADPGEDSAVANGQNSGQGSSGSPTDDAGSDAQNGPEGQDSDDSGDPNGGGEGEAEGENSGAEGDSEGEAEGEGNKGQRTGEQAAADAGLSGDEAKDFAQGYDDAMQGKNDPLPGQAGGECPSCGGTVPMFTGCGSGSGGTPAPMEIGNDSLGGYATAATTDEIEDIRISTATAMIEHASQGRGTVPGHMLAEAEVVLAPPRVPWQRVLGSQLTRACAKQSGKTRRTYTRVNRRRHNVRLGGTGERVLYPGSYQPKLKIMDIRDTSGSMGADELNAVDSEIVGISKTLGISGKYLQVMDVDHYAYDPVPYRSVQDLKKIQGRGGTDMRLGITKALGLPAKDRPDVIIVLTDGFTPWPAVPTDVPIIACLVGPGAETAKENVPDWITSVVVKDPIAA